MTETMIILDTSIWIAFFDKNDTCHKEALNIFMELSREDQLNIPDYIYSEVFSVLKRKANLNVCKDFLKIIKNFEINIELSYGYAYTLATYFFFSFNKLSFTDSLLLASAKLNHATLLTFDKSLNKAWHDVAKRSQRPN